MLQLIIYTHTSIIFIHLECMRSSLPYNLSRAERFFIISVTNQPSNNMRPSFIGIYYHFTFHPLLCAHITIICYSRTRLTTGRHPGQAYKYHFSIPTYLYKLYTHISIFYYTLACSQHILYLHIHISTQGTELVMFDLDLRQRIVFASTIFL